MTHARDAFGSRRWSGAWGQRGAAAGAKGGADATAPVVGATPPLIDATAPVVDATAPVVEVLVPTCGRQAELAVTLAGLAAQDDPAFGVVISDQSDAGAMTPAVQAMVRVLRAQGRTVRTLQNLPRRGMAQQRQFLLQQSAAEFVLFLDDDVWLEPGMLGRLYDAIRTLECGFVGAAVQGLSYLDDDRPEERTSFGLWPGKVEPERLRRDGPGFERWKLHNAANLAHQAALLDVPIGGWLAYRVAWVGGCVLYRRQALEEVGGFGFWSDLPTEHAGEDVAAQWLVMERFGGAGIIPSGAVHLESPTTVADRRVNAIDVVFGEERARERARERSREPAREPARRARARSREPTR